MGETFQKRISALLLSNRRHARYLAVLVCSALVVALGVTATLMRPGQAKTHEEVVLDCQYSGNGAHTHDASCYDANGSLVCPLEEREYHVHDDSCYASETYLVCGLEEGAGAHTHDESCYDEEGNLVCDLEESAGHVHDDSCWQTDTWLDCGKEEITEEHVHGDGCFKTIVVEDVEPEETSEPEPEVKDAEPEPEANTNTKVETPAKKATTASEPATATTADNGDQTFVGQLKDEDDNVVLAVNVKAPKGALPEGAIMRVKPIEAVDVASKVNEVVKAEVGEDKVAKSIVAVDIAFLDKDGNEIEPSKKVEVKITTAAVKDIDSPMLIHIDKDETKDPEVIKNATKVNADEKDTSTGHEDTLKFDTDKFSPYIITEVGTADQEQAETAETEDAADFPAQEFESETDELIVKVSAPEGAFPADTTMTVAAVDDEETIESVSAAAAEGVENAQVAKVSAVDITFTDVEGNEIQPLLPINVTMTSKDAPEQNDLVVVHVDNEGEASVVDQSVITTEADEVVFKADSFSVYAVVEMETISTEMITASGKTLTVRVSYDEEAEIPADAYLEVREILPEDEDYEQYYNATVEAYEAESANDEDEVFSLFEGMSIIDISILSAAGEKIQPAAPVQVDIRYDQPVAVEEEAEVGVVHFGEEAEVLPAEAETDQEGSVESVNFEAASFSTYSVVFVRNIQQQLNNQTFAIGWWDNENGGNFHYYAMTSSVNNGYLGYTEVTDTSNGEIDVRNAGFFTFEKNPNNNTYRIYTVVNGQRRYLQRNGNGNSVALTTNVSNATYFTINMQSNAGGSTAKIQIIPPNTQANNYALSGVNNNRGFNFAGGNHRYLTLVQVNDYVVNSNGIKVHYVKDDGTPIDLSAYPDKYIAETLKEEGAPGYHETYLYGDIYDLYINIPGYTYDSTHLGTYNGTQINVENVFISSTKTWEYEEPNEPTHGNHATNYDLKQIPDGSEIYVVYKEGSESTPGHAPVDPGELPEPKPQKLVKPNHDGTYEMTLSVNASSKPVDATKGANVIVIFDRSSSMGTDVPGVGGSRLSNAVTALNNITGLLDLKQGTTPLVDMMLIAFNAGVVEETEWTNNPETILAGAGGNISPGTCWEAAVRRALQRANERRASGDKDDTYIIFLTDGNPWEDNQLANHDSNVQEFFHHGSYFYTTEAAREIVRSGYELYGIGMYGNIQVLHYLMNFAYTGRSTYDTTPNANGHFFPAADQDSLIQALQSIAGTISGTLSMAGVDFKDGMAISTTTKPDTTMTSLNPVTVNNVRVLAGVTYSKQGGSTKDYSVHIDASGNATFKVDGTSYSGSLVNKTYDRITEDGTGTVSATAYVYRCVVEGVTYELPLATLSDKGDLEWDLAPLGTLENAATYSITTTVWPDQDAYDLVTDLNNGMATWDSTAEEPVKDDDGNVLFYKNGAKLDGKTYEHIVRYPTNPPTYAALSNDYQNLNYFVVEQIDGVTTYTPGPEIPMDYPDPMDLTDSTINIKKVWETDMMTGRDPYPVTLDLLRDNHIFISGITLDPVHDTVEKFIAPGLMITKAKADERGISGEVVTFDNGTSVAQYVLLNEGYDYEFKERKDPNTTNYQLKEVIYHPMLIGNDQDSEKPILVDVTIEGTNVTLSGNDVSSGLVATNQLKGGINITKEVQDAAGQVVPNITDTFKAVVTLHVPMKGDEPDFTNVEDEYAEDAQGHYIIGDDGEYVIATPSVAWYKYYKNDGITEVPVDQLGFAGETNHKYGKWFMLDFNESGIAEGTVVLHPNYILRFTNMAAGTTYSVVETPESAAGYDVSYSYTHQRYVNGEPSGEPVPDVAGKPHVVEVNQGNNAKVINKQVKSDLIIIKADENGTPITSENDTAKFELVVNTAIDGSGNWVSAVDTDTHEIAKDGTFTIKATSGIELKGLQDGIYRLTELKAPQGYIILTEPMTFKLSGGVVKFVTITSSEVEGETVWTVTELDKLDGYTITPKTTDKAAQLKVNNTPGKPLPVTGGPGTTIFTIIGSAVMAMAVTYGISSRRRREGRSHI